MVRAAPRYDARLLDAIRELDRPDQPMAETCRQVGERAAELGLARPSYVHVRRLISAERDRLDAQRERRHAIRAILTEVATDLTVGRRFDVYDVADRIQSARERS